MMRYRSTAVIAACATCLGWALDASSNSGLEQSITDSLTNSPHPFLVVQSPSAVISEQRFLKPGSQGLEVAASESATDQSRNSIKKWRRLFLVLLTTLAIAGGGILLLQKWLRRPKKVVAPTFPPDVDNLPTQNAPTNSLNDEPHTNGHSSSDLNLSNSSDAKSQSQLQASGASLSVKKTTRLARINIVEELIKDLQAPDPQKQRKAIWELAQQGDSRAVQPLVDLMIDSDSKQRSLILEALSQIGTKTLKPMNRALAVSLQDDNAEVRKNAIRDVTRIYELVAQISQMLCHAADDPNPEVQETARWAMSQLSRIRTLETLDNLPPSQSSRNLSENQLKDPPQ